MSNDKVQQMVKQELWKIPYTVSNVLKHTFFLGGGRGGKVFIVLM